MVEKIISGLAIAAFILMTFSIPVTATEPVTSIIFQSESGNIHIQDDADLLSDSEEAMLFSAMAPVSEYGKVIFLTTNSGSASKTAENFYRSIAGRDSGVIFLIDMGCREIYIFSDGDIYDVLGDTYALGITDNIYRYATDGEYYECAKEAFEQIYTVLSNGKLLIPMKYLNNFFLSFAFSIIIMYLYAVGTRKKLGSVSKNVSGSKIQKYAEENNDIRFSNISKVLHQKVYHSSGSSGGGSSGGGGGGGGHSSGGGGGHGF